MRILTCLAWTKRSRGKAGGGHAQGPRAARGPTGLDVAIVPADAAPARVQRRRMHAVARALHLLLLLPDLLPVPDQEHMVLQHEVPARGREARPRRSLRKRSRACAV